METNVNHMERNACIIFGSCEHFTGFRFSMIFSRRINVLSKCKSLFSVSFYSGKLNNYSEKYFGVYLILSQTAVI